MSLNDTLTSSTFNEEEEGGNAYSRSLLDDSTILDRFDLLKKEENSCLCYATNASRMLQFLKNLIFTRRGIFPF